MHGQLSRALCAACGHRRDAPEIMQTNDPCPACNAPATRPDVVWFGEIPYQMDAIWDRLRTADLFVAIGMSGNVYPAAAFVQDANRTGADTPELNLEPSSSINDFARARHGKATGIVQITGQNMNRRSKQGVRPDLYAKAASTAVPSRSNRFSAKGKPSSIKPTEGVPVGRLKPQTPIRLPTLVLRSASRFSVI